uniref:Uncharacterized protein n=1 Tax=Meloidogyne enterolobii TaxID=390850 RepID=A0A6V7UA91_MELEN|nr:unnamed protein product [Meloidogyne enterolobii]
MLKFLFPLFFFALINNFNIIECAPGGYGYGGGMSGGGGGFGSMGGGSQFGGGGMQGFGGQGGGGGGYGGYGGNKFKNVLKSTRRNI